jgi:ankyrin repeat protein
MAERKVITADDFKDADSIQNMIENKCGGNVNGNDEEGYTPLCAAILLGVSQEILIDFIRNPEINDSGDHKYYKGKIDPNKKCNKGKTPLQMISMSMNTAALDVLMGASIEVPAFITNPYSGEQIPQYKLDPTTHEYTTEQDTVEISVNPSYYYDNKDIKVEARDVMSSSILPKPEIFQKLIGKFEKLYLNYKSLIDKDLNNPLHLACIVSCYGIIDSLENAIVKTILESLDAAISSVQNSAKQALNNAIIALVRKTNSNISDDAISEVINAIMSDVSIFANNYVDDIRAELEEKLNITFSNDDDILEKISEARDAIVNFTIQGINKKPIELIMSFFVNAPNKDGKTPFMIAFENEDDGMMSMLSPYVLTATVISMFAYALLNYATSDGENTEDEQSVISPVISRLIDVFITQNLNNLHNMYNDIFSYLGHTFTLPGDKESSLLQYIKEKFTEVFNSVIEKIKGLLEESLQSTTFNESVINSLYSNKLYTSNEFADTLKDIDKLTDIQQIKQFDKDIQPIIGTLTYVPYSVSHLYCNSGIDISTYYTINNCIVKWSDDIPHNLTGKRCYFSAT